MNSLKANNGLQALGVGDERLIDLKRNVLYLQSTITRHHLNHIILQIVERFNQWSKFTNISYVYLKD